MKSEILSLKEAESNGLFRSLLTTKVTYLFTPKQTEFINNSLLLLRKYLDYKFSFESGYWNMNDMYGYFDEIISDISSIRDKVFENYESDSDKVDLLLTIYGSDLETFYRDYGTKAVPNEGKLNEVFPSSFIIDRKIGLLRFCFKEKIDEVVALLEDRRRDVLKRDWKIIDFIESLTPVYNKIDIPLFVADKNLIIHEIESDESSDWIKIERLNEE